MHMCLTTLWYVWHDILMSVTWLIRYSCYMTHSWFWHDSPFNYHIYACAYTYTHMYICMFMYTHQRVHIRVGRTMTNFGRGVPRQILAIRHGTGSKSRMITGFRWTGRRGELPKVTESGAALLGRWIFASRSLNLRNHSSCLLNSWVRSLNIWSRVCAKGAWIIRDPPEGEVEGAALNITWTALNLLSIAALNITWTSSAQRFKELAEIPHLVAIVQPQLWGLQELPVAALPVARSPRNNTVFIRVLTLYHDGFSKSVQGYQD